MEYEELFEKIIARIDVAIEDNDVERAVNWTAVYTELASSVVQQFVVGMSE